MKKYIGIFAAVLTALVSCSEWEPVTTLNYGKAGMYEPVELQVNTSIAELKALYTKEGNPLKIDDDEMVIGGQVVSEDRSGNIYKSLYIQDATGGIELKLGKNSMYNDYKPGQWIYVKCEGLTLGDYKGMLQLGWRRNRRPNGEIAGDTDAEGETSDEYETTYIENDYIIKTHIFRGKLDDPVEPKVLTENDLQANLAARPLIHHGSDFGTLVTLKGLRYGNEVFCLLYPEPDKQHDNTTIGNHNRVFLSDKTWNLTSWALSKAGLISHLNAGDFDEARLADGSTAVSDPALKATMIKYATAYAVSHYFLMGSTQVQVRSSGYARFADKEIDPDVLEGRATIDVTGILVNYTGSIQFTLIDEDSVTINK